MIGAREYSINLDRLPAAVPVAEILSPAVVHWERGIGEADWTPPPVRVIEITDEIRAAEAARQTAAADANPWFRFKATLDASNLRTAKRKTLPGRVAEARPRVLAAPKPKRSRAKGPARFCDCGVKLLSNNLCGECRSCKTKKKATQQEQRVTLPAPVPLEEILCPKTSAEPAPAINATNAPALLTDSIASLLPATASATTKKTTASSAPPAAASGRANATIITADSKRQTSETTTSTTTERPLCSKCGERKVFKHVAEGLCGPCFCNVQRNQAQLAKRPACANAPKCKQRLINGVKRRADGLCGWCAVRAKRNSPEQHQQKRQEADKRCAVCSELIHPDSTMCRKHARKADTRQTVLKAGSVEEWKADLLWAELSAEDKWALLEVVS